MTDYKIDELLSVINFEENKFQTTRYNLFLTNYEIAVLKKYHIDYVNCKTAKEILQRVESIISDLDDLEQEKLDQVGMSIAERDYYKNTNK